MKCLQPIEGHEDSVHLTKVFSILRCWTMILFSFLRNIRNFMRFTVTEKEYGNAELSGNAELAPVAEHGSNKRVIRKPIRFIQE